MLITGGKGRASVRFLPAITQERELGSSKTQALVTGQRLSSFLSDPVFVGGLHTPFLNCLANDLER